jgi:hypothetical protein
VVQRYPNFLGRGRANIRLFELFVLASEPCPGNVALDVLNPEFLLRVDLVGECLRLSLPAFACRERLRFLVPVAVSPVDDPRSLRRSEFLDLRILLPHARHGRSPSKMMYP